MSRVFFSEKTLDCLLPVAVIGLAKKTAIAPVGSLVCAIPPQKYLRNILKTVLDVKGKIEGTEKGGERDFRE